MQPASAAANQTQPCSEPEATPPTKAPMLQPKPSRAPQPISSPPSAAAASDLQRRPGRARERLGGGGRGHGAEDHAEIGQARGVAQDRVRASARLGPGHCQNSAPERSKPSERGELGAPHREAEGHAPRMAAGGEHGDREQPDHDRADHDARAARHRAPRRRATARSRRGREREARQRQRRARPRGRE